jgi:hypothetical protein
METVSKVVCGTQSKVVAGHITCRDVFHLPSALHSSDI